MKKSFALTVLFSGIYFSTLTQKVNAKGEIGGIQNNLHSSGKNKIQGVFPGKENKKVYITYFPPGLGGSKFSDSCIIGNDGRFEFTSPIEEPVLAAIRFDFMQSFDFVADTGIVHLKPLYSGNDFSFSAIEAESTLNEQYKLYKKFIFQEYSDAGLLYNHRDRLMAERKRDSIKLLEPMLDKADSLLFKKNYDFIVDNSCCQFIKSYVIYRRLMLRLPMEKLRFLTELLGAECKESVYGKAILEFMYSKNGLKTGEPPPSFVNQISPDGKKVYIGDFKGKYLLIDFWGSWCSPCRAENPALLKLYNQYKTSGFEILGVALEKRKEEWMKAIRQDKLPWPQVTDLRFWDSECVKLYGLYSLPFNLLLDKQGKIIEVNLDSEELMIKLKEIFAEK